MIANQQSGTNVYAIAAGIYRINAPIVHLVYDDELKKAA